MKNGVIAIDLGATSGRMILSYLENGKLQMDEIARFPNAIQEKDGKYYWNLEALFGEIKKGLNHAATLDFKITSIGVDTWGVDVAFVDKDGDVISDPRAYRDPYTHGAPEEFFTKIPKEEVYGATGIQIMNFNTLFQLYSANKENYSPYKNADKILFMPDLISYLLTGKMVCEYTILSTSQFLNPKTKQIEEKLINEAGAQLSQFPEIVYPGAVIGDLNQSIMDKPFGYDVPVVAVAGHDTGSAVAAVPAWDENFAYLSSGTWSLMGIEVKEPIISERSAELNFTNEGGVEGTTRFLKNITGMWILEECRKEWERAGKNYSYPEIVAMIDRAEPFRSFINTDDAVFACPKSMLSAIAEYCEERGMPAPDTDERVVRCIMESLALRYRQVFDYLKEFAPFSIDRLHIIGGGAKNALLNQFTADSIGVPVYAGPSEATAIGNIMIQFKAQGIVNDIKEMRELIGKAVELVKFEPQNTSEWDKAYAEFCQKCK